MRPASNLLGVVGLLVCSATLVYGQGTGTLHGIVADPSNLPIAGASVTATLAGRGLSRAVQTSERGEYVIPVLPVGQYTVLAQAQGFKQFRREGVTLTANESVRADVKLEVGDVAEKILVTAEATHVDTRSTGSGVTDQRAQHRCIGRHAARRR